MKGFWITAIFASVIFLMQTAATFLGSDASDGTSADFDSDLDDGSMPFQLFSFRNLVNFLLGFGWGGVAFHELITNDWIVLLLATATGVLFIYLFFIIIRQITKLAENNTFRITETINKTAEVYLTIPGHKSGLGRVLISVRGSVHELSAITTTEKIETGALVKVKALENDEILIVERISN